MATTTMDMAITPAPALEVAKAPDMRAAQAPAMDQALASALTRDALVALTPAMEALVAASALAVAIRDTTMDMATTQAKQAVLALDLEALPEALAQAVDTEVTLEVTALSNCTCVHARTKNGVHLLSESTFKASPML